MCSKENQAVTAFQLANYDRSFGSGEDMPGAAAASIARRNIACRTEQTMPKLWEVCSEEELQQALMNLLTSLTTQELIDSVQYMLPAFNTAEREGFMQGMQFITTPEVYAVLCKTAESIKP